MIDGMVKIVSCYSGVLTGNGIARRIALTTIPAAETFSENQVLQKSVEQKIKGGTLNPNYFKAGGIFVKIYPARDNSFTFGMHLFASMEEYTDYTAAEHRLLSMEIHLDPRTGEPKKQRSILWKILGIKVPPEIDGLDSSRYKSMLAMIHGKYNDPKMSNLSEIRFGDKDDEQPDPGSGKRIITFSMESLLKYPGWRRFELKDLTGV